MLLYFQIPLLSCAAVSGGGLYLHGPLNALDESIFTANTAGEEGPAVMSMGYITSMSNVSFDHNAFSCATGFYGYDAESGTDEVIHL